MHWFLYIVCFLIIQLSSPSPPSATASPQGSRTIRREKGVERQPLGLTSFLCVPFLLDRFDTIQRVLLLVLLMG